MPSEIVKILENIAQAINKDDTFDDIEKFIRIGSKIKPNTLAAAYSWIYEKKLREMYSLKELESPKSKGFRIISNEEASTIELNNCNYLLHLQNIGLLDNIELDLILRQINLYPEEERTLENINLFVLAIYLDFNKTTTPGNRYLLSVSDTIN